MLNQISSINHLKTFTLAAQYLSFKDAAHVLSITPTAVSHQIKALEASLRTTLFERHIRSISLTEAGLKLAQTCQTVFSQLDYTLKDITQEKTDINISCCNSFAALWLTPNSTALNQLFPDHTIKICASDSLINFNQNKHIDLALRYGKKEENEDEIFLCNELIGLYRSPNYKPKKGTKPILFVTQWPSNGLLEKIKWEQFIDTSKYTIKTFEQEYFVLQAIMTGQGYGLLSNVLSTTAIDSNWIVEDDKIEPFEGYGYWLRTNPDRKELSAIRKLSRWFKQTMNDS